MVSKQLVEHLSSPNVNLSYPRDNRREYENAEKPQKHHVSGVFLLPLETW